MFKISKLKSAFALMLFCLSHFPEHYQVSAARID
jgi:hypothetical protein